VKKRLDELLVEHGHVATRSRARDAILRGLVRVDEIIVSKPGASIPVTAKLDVAPEAGTAYVSRGALKLIAALDHFGFDPSGRNALDAGASTGGFTQVLLERGAARVTAVDVGHSQLHPKIAADPRVVSREGQDIRTLDPAIIGDAPDAIVADVSFISLTKVLPHLMQLAAPRCWLVALIKPQFEVGRDAVGKGGIVRDEAARAQSIETLSNLVTTTPGWMLRGVIASPIEGGSGNTEYLMGLTRDG
jgi:23S rRNA (cytidine1920-2'-O)/16S rRNA (cytidine1409-2'-O)-methyltransferase